MINYENFYDQASKLKEEAQFHFFDLFSDTMFAFAFSLIMFCLIIPFINKGLGSNKYSTYLQGLANAYNGREGYGYYIFLYIIKLLLGIVLLIVSWVHVYYKEENSNRDKINQVYVQYMEQQEDIKLNVALYYPASDPEVTNLTSDKYDSKSSYIFHNVDCKNCTETEIYYKVNKDDKKYTNTTVLISYSLANGQQPYIETKPQIRENIGHLSRFGLYNPILYVPKSEGGIR